MMNVLHFTSLYHYTKNRFGAHQSLLLKGYKGLCNWPCTSI